MQFLLKTPMISCKNKALWCEPRVKEVPVVTDLDAQGVTREQSPYKSMIICIVQSEAMRSNEYNTLMFLSYMFMYGTLRILHSTKGTLSHTCCGKSPFSICALMSTVAALCNGSGSLFHCHNHQGIWALDTKFKQTSQPTLISLLLASLCRNLRVLGRRPQHIYRSKSPNLYPPKLNQIPCLANNATTLQSYAFKMTSQWCHIGQEKKQTNLPQPQEIKSKKIRLMPLLSASLKDKITDMSRWYITCPAAMRESIAHDVFTMCDLSLSKLE